MLSAPPLFAKFALGGASRLLAGAWSGPLRYAATPAAAGLCASSRPTPTTPNWREAALLPLFCLLIVGLAEAIRSRACQLHVLAW